MVKYIKLVLNIQTSKEKEREHKRERECSIEKART